MRNSNKDGLGTFGTLKLFYFRNLAKKIFFKGIPKQITWKFSMPKTVGSFLKTMGKTGRCFLLGKH